MDRARLALILVRNTVSHDNRVLREVETLELSGYAVLVAGVVSTDEPDRRARVGDTNVVRLDPLAALGRRRRRRPDPFAAPEAEPGPTPTPPNTSSNPGSARAGRARTRARLRRLAVTASYYTQGAALCARTAPALVHANDYNTMWIALAAKLLRGSRVVYDCHELWGDRNGRPELRAWLLACEAAFVRLADVTITASPGYAEAIARRYRVPRPIVVRNISAAPDASVPALARAPGPPLAVYIGGLMPGRGLEQGIDALALVPDLRMRLIGPGSAAYRSSLVALAQRLGVVDRLELAAPVAPTAVLEALADADIGLMLIQPICRSYELTLPNKLFEYAAAGLPILASDLPVIGRVVREEALGVVVAPGDTEQIAAGLRALADPERNREIRTSVRCFARANLWERERAVLASVYATVAAVG